MLSQVIAYNDIVFVLLSSIFMTGIVIILGVVIVVIILLIIFTGALFVKERYEEYLARKKRR